MSNFEYQVIPSPRKGKPAKGLRGVPMKFANALATVMNEMAQQGWEYVRADTLPCEERKGLAGKTVNYQSVLVFRREAELAAELELAAEEEPTGKLKKEVFEEKQQLADEPQDQYKPDPETQRYHEQAQSIDSTDRQRGKSLAAE